ncbi:MAG: Disulfide-bond oxidoreductase YfcG [Stenotrophomonas maltophilia]|nr:MAG: Disulfide-bond oxidoreductase YfcG [Stenotrophomonas maltophilia]
MPQDRRITFFHAPQTRSTSTLVLLGELGADYDLHLINLQANEQREPAFLAVNPLGKVPAIRHGEALVTEQGAIFLYLADLYAEAGLAPALDDPLRGPYLRWMVLYGSSFEPAVVDHAFAREPLPEASCPYGTYDSVIRTLAEQLERGGPYLLGERFTALDVLWASALNWTISLGAVSRRPAFERYLEQVVSRPAFLEAGRRDAQWVVEHAHAVQPTENGVV